MILTIVKNMKEVEPYSILLFKVGNFYYAYGKDAYIMLYLFGYKIRMIQEKTPNCGFPKNALSKVQAKLEEKKINYMLLDKRNNFDVDEKSDNKNLNKYEIFLEKAKQYVKIYKKIEKIKNDLMKQAEEDDIIDKLRKIEEITNESRKV